MIKKHTMVLLFIIFALPSTAQEAEGDQNQPAVESDQTTVTEPPQAQPKSSIQLKTTSVTGSRELPKVLVIVPWKTSDSVSPGERPLASLVEEVLTPLDPDVFRRELDYYSDLETASKKNADSSNK